MSKHRKTLPQSCIFPGGDFPFNVITSVKGYETFGESKNYHIHPFAVEIQYIRSGSGYYFIKNRKYPFKAGTLFIIHGDELHAFIRGEEGVLVKKTYMAFSYSFFAKYPEMKPVMDKISKCRAGFHHRLQLDGTSATHVEFLADILQGEWDHKGVFHKEAIVNALSQLLIFIIRLSENAPRTLEPKRKEHPLIDKVFKHIDSNFKSQLTLSDISRHVCYSPFYVSHMIKDYTGFSFQENLISRRVIEAKRLLESSPDMKIISICEASGFNDISVFNRDFKKLAGMTPSQYRRLCESFRS